MKREFVILLVILFFFVHSLGAQASEGLWNTEKTQHFIIYYQSAQASFIRDLAYAAERYYNSIIDELGFRRMDFWSWDNRAKIYIYNGFEDYKKEADRKDWSGAVVFVDTRTIKSFLGQFDFFDSILPHEMTHIIFREFVGREAILPLCIDEGVASSQEKGHLHERLSLIKKLILQGKYMHFDKLFNIYQAKGISPQEFYAQSASLVVFLIKQYGRERFVDFSRKLRDGMLWDKALLSVYKFKSFADMENEWKDFILRNF
jgi:hypothetical protein